MTCSHTFSPHSLFTKERLSEPLIGMTLSDMSVQECNRETLDGYDFCMFHLSEEERRKAGIPESKTREKIISELEDSKDNSFNLYDGSIDDLTLTPNTIGAHQTGKINFTGTTIHGEVTIRNITVREFSGFKCVFEDDVSISKTEISDDSTFRYSEFESELRLSGSKFREHTDFMEVTFKDRFSSGSTFQDSVEFRQAEFLGDVSFRGTTVDGNLDLEYVSLDGRIDMVWLDVQYIRFRPNTFDNRLILNLSVANIAGGKIAIVDNMYINLNSTTIGNLYFGPIQDYHPMDEFHSDREFNEEDLFEHILIRDTEFDGFEFQRYRDVLERIDWEIHRTKIGIEEFHLPMYYSYYDDEEMVEKKSLEGMVVNQLESTYQKAKRGAKLVSDQKSVSEFFYKEMKYKRFRHIANAKEADRLFLKLRYTKDWVINAAFDGLAGYGERPLRVGVSFLIVYFLLIPLIAPFISSIEGVRNSVAALFVAILVFSLTRSVDR